MADKCSKAPDSTYLEAKGAVNLGSKVVHSVRASYLPPCMTDFDCADCFDAL